MLQPVRTKWRKAHKGRIHGKASRCNVMNYGSFGLKAIQPEIREQIEIDALYAGYLGRQQADIETFRKDENLLLPADLDFRAVGSLSNEICQKLEQVRPQTLGAASRIPGVTPAAILALLRYTKRQTAKDKDAA
mgnify:CR=1 FL=1